MLLPPIVALATPTPAPTALPEVGRVVTSDRHEEPLSRAARTTFVVSKAEMIKRGYVTIAQALNSVPGVLVTLHGALGASANLSIRGSSSSQVLVLLDGRPLEGAQTGTLDVGQLLTSGVERIEVVEGSGSTLYGAGAVGGVVNILTSHPDHAPLVQLSGGSFDSQAVDVETQHVAFERALVGNAFPYIGTTVPSGTRINSDVQWTTARVRDGAMLGKVRFDASLGLASQHLGVPGPVALPFSSPAPDPNLAASYQSSTTRQNTSSGDALATFSLKRPQSTTTLDLSGTEQTLLFYSSPGDPLGCYTAAFTQPCSDLDRETRLQASLRDAVQTQNQALVYGIDLARGDARLDAGAGQIETHAFAQTAAYAQDSFSIGTGSLYAGLRAERDGGQGGALAPSIGGIAPLSPALALRVNFAEAFRAPTAVDLYYPGFSNPNLQPERTQSFDATLTDTHVLGTTSLTYFTLTGNDLITVNANYNYSAPPGPGNEPVINAQHASIAGFTLAVQTPPLNGWTTTLGVTDLYRALDLTSQAVRLAQRPVFNTSLALEYAAPGPRRGIAAFGLIAHSVGARSSLPPNFAIDPTQYAAAYTTIHGYLRSRLAPRALLTARVVNLGNERYSEIASPPYGGYPATGRAFALELSTR